MFGQVNCWSKLDVAVVCPFAVLVKVYERTFIRIARHSRARLMIVRPGGARSGHGNYDLSKDKSTIECIENGIVRD